MISLIKKMLLKKLRKQNDFVLLVEVKENTFKFSAFGKVSRNDLENAFHQMKHDMFYDDIVQDEIEEIFKSISEV